MRKSANETLFATLATHGDIFSIENWYVSYVYSIGRKITIALEPQFDILHPNAAGNNNLQSYQDLLHEVIYLRNRQLMVWKTLFPLLESVQSLSRSAPAAPEVSQIIVHHSRNTTAKQWEETRALALTGVARVFCAQHKFDHTQIRSLGKWIHDSVI